MRNTIKIPRQAENIILNKNKLGYKTMAKKVELTKNQLANVAELFEEIPNSQIIDKTINNAISKYRNNNNQSNVYIKVVLINVLYKTAIINTPKLANHIFNKCKEIDKKLKKGDISVIDDIRHGHKIGTNGESKKERDFYSFATKYAHFHNPKAFPICDNRVIRLLAQANRQLLFYDSKFSQKGLRDYQKYKSVIDSLAERLCISGWGYKKIDQGLWLWARNLYNPESFKSLSPSFRKKLKSIIGQ